LGVKEGMKADRSRSGNTRTNSHKALTFFLLALLVGVLFIHPGPAEADQVSFSSLSKFVQRYLVKLRNDVDSVRDVKTGGIKSSLPGDIDEMKISGNVINFAGGGAEKGNAPQISFNQGGSTIFDNGDLNIWTDDNLRLNATQILTSGRFNFGTNSGSYLFDNGDLHLATDDNLYLDASNAVHVSNDLRVAGTIYGTISGSINPSFTTGSVILQGSNGLTEDNSNFYWDATNHRLGLGTTSNINSVLTFAAGTTAAGGILFGTDTNLYRSAADTLKTDDSVIVAGAEGIGAAPPASDKFYIKGSSNSTTTYALHVYNSDSAELFYVRDDGKARFFPQGTQSFGVDDAVNNSALDQLNTSHLILSNTDTTLGSHIVERFQLGDGENAYIDAIRPANDAVAITFGTRTSSQSLTEHLRIQQDGNIGIATSSNINSRLTFAAGTTAAGGILFGTDTNLYRSAADTLKTDDSLTVAGTLTASGTFNPGFTQGSVVFQGTSGIAEDNAKLYWNNSTKQEYIGIGPSATAPDTIDRLLVYGAGSGIGTEMAGIRIGKETGPRIVATQEAIDNDVQGLAFFTKSSLTFSDPPSEAMRITNDGNVGIGLSSSFLGKIHVQTSPTDTSGTALKAGYFAALPAPTSDSSATFRGIQTELTMSGSANYSGNQFGNATFVTHSGSGNQTGILTAVHGTVQVSGGGTIGTLIGGQFIAATVTSATTVSNMYGGQFRITNSVSGTNVTTGIGVRVQTPSVTGTSTYGSMYGIRIQNQGVSGITTAIGLQVDAQSAAATNYAAIFEGGNVGIGTTAPSFKNLVIQGAEDTTAVTPGAGSTGIELVNTDSGTLPSRQVDIAFRNSTAADTGRYAAISGLVTGSSGSQQTGAILFSTKTAVADSTLTERMRITSGGSVGIGNSSPQAPLHATVTNASNVISQAAAFEHALSSGTAAAGLGVGLRFFLPSDTTAQQNAGLIAFTWVDATHASRHSKAGIFVAGSSGSSVEGFAVETDQTVQYGYLSGNAPASATLAKLRLGAAIASGNAAGTYLGVNAQNGFTGDLINAEVNGTSQISVDNAGLLTFKSATAATTGLQWGTDTNLYRSATDTLKTDDSFTVATNLTVGGKTILTPSAVQTITSAGTAITVAASVVQVKGDAARTLTSTPTIADGTDGQVVYIIGNDNTNTITIQDEGTLSGSNIELPTGTTTRVLGNGDVEELIFNSTKGQWLEVSYTNID
jgi:hypothetical protein